MPAQEKLVNPYLKNKLSIVLYACNSTLLKRWKQNALDLRLTQEKAQKYVWYLWKREGCGERVYEGEYSANIVYTYMKMEK
jgi:hypothetical protein